MGLLGICKFKYKNFYNILQFPYLFARKFLSLCRKYANP